MAADAVIGGVYLPPAAPHIAGDVDAVHHDVSPDVSGLFDPDCCFFVSAGQPSRPRNRNPASENGYSLRSLSLIASSLALQLLFLRGSESMGNHDSKIVDAGSVD